MAGKEKNNKLIQKNIILNENAPSGSGNGEIVNRGRGRPKGTTGITRKDNIQSCVPDDIKQKILSFNMILYKLPKITDRNDTIQIQTRTDQYFSLCIEHAITPTVAGFAFSLGIDRRTLWTWINNKNDVIKNQTVIDILKTAYDFINNSYEQLLTEGKIVPVSAFFLLQNNYGYKQQTDHVITTEQNNNVTDEDIYNKADLLD